MDFCTVVTEELTAFARRLADAAAADKEAAVTETTARWHADLDSVRTAVRHAADTDIALAQDAAATAIAEAHAAAEATAALKASAEETLERLRIDYAQLGADNERLAAENAALTCERQALVNAAQMSHRGTLIARLRGIFDLVASATTVEDMLVAATGGLDDDFSRVAVFLSRDHRLRAVHQRGFDATSDCDRIDQLPGLELFLNDAVQSADVRALVGVDAAITPFGGTPTLAVTIPLCLRGEIVALFYADDEGRAIGDGSAQEGIGLAILLGGHVSLRLERLTLELNARTELRTYAQMLLDEIEYIYTADMKGNLPPVERVERLEEHLRCARHIYRQRVTLEDSAAEVLLEDVIFHAVDQKAATPFGDDLGHVLSRELAEAAASA
jgi:hypothetical protein